MPARICILGASFAGLGAAGEIRRLLPATDAQVTVIDRRDQFVFRPSLPWLAFRERELDDMTVPLAPLLDSWGVDFVQDEVTAIQPREQRVVGRQGHYDYDFLVIALGATSPPDAPPHLAKYGYHPLWPDSVLALRSALDHFSGGGTVITLCPNCPLSCPTYEMVFYMDRLLRAKGLRHRSPITVVSYEDMPFTAGGGAASSFMKRQLAQRGIEFRPFSFVEDAVPGIAFLPGGEVLPASLIIYLPAFQGPPAVRATEGLTDAAGFLLVDTYMRSLAHANIFGAGGIVAAPGPKNGRMAEIQGRVAARNIAALLGHGQPTPYTSHMACLLDLGGNSGLATVRKPAPQRGRTHTYFVLPGRLPHAAKVALERYYMGMKWRIRRTRSLTRESTG